jgi:hypothetical protein
MDMVNHEELEDTLRLHYQTKLPLFVHGAPGIGKSMTAEDVGREIADQEDRQFVDFSEVYNEDKKSMEGEESTWNLSGTVSVEDIKKNPEDYFVLVDLRLSQEDPTTSKGIPNTDGLSTTWAPPVWLNVLSLEGMKGMLFADELNQAHPDVQAAYFQLVQKRQLAGRRLSEHILVVSAGNREKDEADVKPIPAPLRNRFAAHVNLMPPASTDWVDWARSFNEDIQEGNSDEIPIHHTVLQFIGSNIGDSHLFEDISDSPEKSAFQTPRTWQYAGQQLTQYQRMSDEFDLDMAQDIVRRAVGTGSANTYYGFLQASQSIDLQNLFENPDTLENLNTSQTNVNTMYVLATSITNYYNRSINEEIDVDPSTALENIFNLFEYESFNKDWRMAIFSDLKQLDENLLVHIEEADMSEEVLAELIKQV